MNEEVENGNDSKLLEAVKKHLKITWNDEDDNIKDIIEEAKQYLSRVIGTEINFDEDKESKALLKDYVRYVRNYSLEEFEKNFQSKILGVQIEYATSEQETPSVQ